MHLHLLKHPKGKMWPAYLGIWKLKRWGEDRIWKKHSSKYNTKIPRRRRDEAPGQSRDHYDTFTPFHATSTPTCNSIQYFVKPLRSDSFWVCRCAITARCNRNTRMKIYSVPIKKNGLLMCLKNCFSFKELDSAEPQWANADESGLDGLFSAVAKADQNRF